MNPEQHVTFIAELIAEKSKEYGGPLHVCIFEKKIQVLPALHTERKHPVLLVIKDPVTWEGLSTPQWGALKYRLIELMKECPE